MNDIYCRYEEESVNLTKELIKIPSGHADGPEIYEYTLNYLKEQGVDARFQNFENPFVTYTEFKNIILVLGNGKGPKVMINGHLDTVMPKKGWFYNPYSGEEIDGKIYGVGASDMKAGCAAAIASILKLVDSKKEINGTLFLSLVFGEEAAYSFGSDTLLREHSFKNYDFIIVTEPSPVLAENSYCVSHKKIHKTKYPVIVVGAEGRVLFEVEFFGKSSHASQPSLGINAIHDAAKFIQALDDFDLYSNIKMGRGHYNSLSVKGGTEGFTIPDYCIIQVNRNLIVGENPKTAISEIKRVIKKIKPRSKVVVTKRYTPSPQHEYNPYLFENNPFINKFKEVIPKENEKELCDFTTRSVGDFNFFGTRTKVPTLVFGPGGGNIHSANEFVYKEDIKKTTRYLYEFFNKIF